MTPHFSEWEDRVRKLARRFPYPPAPDLRGRIPRPEGRRPRGRRWTWVAGAFGAFMLALGILLASPARAGLLEFLQIGAVRIRLQPLPTPSKPAATPSPASEAIPETRMPGILDLAGETTLEAAQARVPFPIRLPTYPPALGRPDRVYLQDLGGPTVIMVWQDPARPGRARLALFLIGRGALVEKFTPRVLTATTVRGRPALWAEGPYLLQTRSGDWTLQRLVEGNVLLWTEGEVTYRLETDQGMEEAVRIAESLTPL